MITFEERKARQFVRQRNASSVQATRERGIPKQSVSASGSHENDGPTVGDGGDSRPIGVAAHGSVSSGCCCAVPRTRCAAYSSLRHLRRAPPQLVAVSGPRSAHMSVKMAQLQARLVHLEIQAQRHRALVQEVQGRVEGLVDEYERAVLVTAQGGGGSPDPRVTEGRRTLDSMLRAKWAQVLDQTRWRPRRPTAAYYCVPDAASPQPASCKQCARR